MGGNYILAYATEPEVAREDHANAPQRTLLCHANYHPDGGQLFFPLDHRSYYVPLALPGDDITPEKFVCFRFDGHEGLYIHLNIWHEGVFALNGTQRFLDKQRAVHARVSVDFAREFDCLLEAPLADAFRLPCFGRRPEVRGHIPRSKVLEIIDRIATAP
ncbi:ureidoglycolate lyase [Paraburkholderia sp. RL17-337-BIB-A]|uniref:ureidoglycolate lyase n=1 Tax=Paraburkholderia sp. RL17-337-BIB-A TaxID=3031636 RepID=UPI0038BA5EA3